MSIIDSKQACFYHPTKVIFLDDNKGFLEAMEMEFSEQYNMMTFTDPNEALLAINNSKEDLLVNAVGLHEEKCSDDSHYTDGINISHLINMTYDRSRFDNVAVLVIDYDMPEINGIDFCNNLGDRHLFKILLTAEAGKDIAINAFNSGVIDQWHYLKPLNFLRSVYPVFSLV